jgi:predicted AAA+ superfamily ATPase
VDRGDPTPGRFLLTGSAAPLTAPTHSGAGRIVQVRMRPMSLAERCLTLPFVSLAARLLRADAGTLLDDTVPGALSLRQGPLLGALFESLVTLSVRVYAQAAEAGVHHLRTRDGDHEIDLIVQRDDQRVLALEVKLAVDVRSRLHGHLQVRV